MNSALRTLVLGGVLGAGVVSGGALAFAQTSASTTTAPTTEAPGTTATTAPTSPPGTTAPGDQNKADGTGRGRKGRQARHPLARLKHLKGVGQDLATELGVPLDQLRDASKAARQVVRDQLGQPQKPATRPPSEEDRAKRRADLKARAELYTKTLADKLGVTPQRLRDARIAVLGKRLDTAVANGRLSREQADKILERARQHG